MAWRAHRPQLSRRRARIPMKSSLHPRKSQPPPPTSIAELLFRWRHCWRVHRPHPLLFLLLCPLLPTSQKTRWRHASPWILTSARDVAKSLLSFGGGESDAADTLSLRVTYLHFFVHFVSLNDHRRCLRTQRPRSISNCFSSIDRARSGLENSKISVTQPGIWKTS